MNPSKSVLRMSMAAPLTDGCNNWKAVN